uniref:Secreted protein n=1 Tax=Steinernema glaseri TaxID=37863 RepID=A0A1I7YZK9_9BILA
MNNAVTMWVFMRWATYAPGTMRRCLQRRKISAIYEALIHIGLRGFCEDVHPRQSKRICDKRRNLNNERKNKAVDKSTLPIFSFHRISLQLFVTGSKFLGDFTASDY